MKKIFKVNGVCGSKTNLGDVNWANARQGDLDLSELGVSFTDWEIKASDVEDACIHTDWVGLWIREKTLLLSCGKKIFLFRLLEPIRNYAIFPFPVRRTYDPSRKTIVMYCIFALIIICSIFFEF